jgi:DNA-binding transcriptional MerR regulator
MNSRPDRPLKGREVAALFGVSRDALRHYERCGLLAEPQRTAGGYRMYSPAAVERIRLIRGALAIGFTVEELKRILRERDAGGAPCSEVLQLATAKLRDLDLRIAELEKLRKQLRGAVADWERRLRGAGEHERVRLLESFITSCPESARATSPQVSPGLARTIQRSKFKLRKNEVKGNAKQNRSSSSRNGIKRLG